MRITLTNVAKRFNRDWIFRNLNFSFEQNTAYAIIGPNGSGKSTLLQLLSGNLILSEGAIEFNHEFKKILSDNIFKYVSFCAPNFELIEEMTAFEFLNFHQKFKPFIQNISIQEILDLIGLANNKNKQIRFYSSGMKQRIKLAQCFFSNSLIMLLDEPCTNLDNEGINLYHKLISNYSKNRIVVVSSNDEQEYFFCQEKLLINIYKPEQSTPVQKF